MRGTSPTVLPHAKAERMQGELDRKFPDLTVGCAGSNIHVRGAFPILHNGKVLDRYQIKIDWSDSDTEAPLLFETGGRIPWTRDRHMGEGGKACPIVPEEWLLRPREMRTIVHYLEGPVRDYFLWQGLVERGESPPGGQRSHHVPGLIEAYGEMLSMSGDAAVKQCLEYLTRERLKGHWMCPCGSNRRSRNCHIEHLRELKHKIPAYIAKLALKRLRDPNMR